MFNGYITKYAYTHSRPPPTYVHMPHRQLSGCTSHIQIRLSAIYTGNLYNSYSEVVWVPHPESWTVIYQCMNSCFFLLDLRKSSQYSCHCALNVNTVYHWHEAVVRPGGHCSGVYHIGCTSLPGMLLLTVK